MGRTVLVGRGVESLLCGPGGLGYDYRTERETKDEDNAEGWTENMILQSIITTGLERFVLPCAHHP